MIDTHTHKRKNQFNVSPRELKRELDDADFEYIRIDGVCNVYRAPDGRILKIAMGNRHEVAPSAVVKARKMIDECVQKRDIAETLQRLGPTTPNPSAVTKALTAKIGEFDWAPFQAPPTPPPEADSNVVDLHPVPEEVQMDEQDDTKPSDLMSMWHAAKVVGVPSGNVMRAVHAGKIKEYGQGEPNNWGRRPRYVSVAEVRIWAATLPKKVQKEEPAPRPAPTAHTAPIPPPPERTKKTPPPPPAPRVTPPKPLDTGEQIKDLCDSLEILMLEKGYETIVVGLGGKRRVSRKVIEEFDL